MSENDSAPAEQWEQMAEEVEDSEQFADLDDFLVSELREQPMTTLMNVARSAREQFDDLEDAFEGLGRELTKDDLTEEMAEVPIWQGAVGDDDFYAFEGEDAQMIDRLEVQTPDSTSSSSGPSDKTILYCLTRAETTDERVEAISDALESETDFELREAGGDGETKYTVVLPVENQDIPEEEEPAEEPEADESSESAESADESDESESEGEQEAESEEPADEQSESAESESEDSSDEDEDEQEQVSAEAVREHWEENKTRQELYQMATDDEIDNRSEMNKAELIDALIEERDEIEVPAE